MTLSTFFKLIEDTFPNTEEELREVIANTKLAIDAMDEIEDKPDYVMSSIAKHEDRLLLMEMKLRELTK
jgi:hypothetical protein